MRIEVHHYIHIETAQLGRIESAVNQLLQRSTQQMATAQEIKDAVSQLTDKVAEQKGDIASMRTFIQGLEAAVQQQLDLANASDEIKASVAAVFSQVSDNTQEIKNAIDSDPTT
jgi:chromosome segregation ATPase